MNEKQVIQRIISIREAKRLTKRDMATQLNMNEASYGRIESGKIALSYSHLVNIASVLDMSVASLVTNETHETEQPPPDGRPGRNGGAANIIHTTNNSVNGDINVFAIKELKEVIDDLRKDKERIIQDKERIIREKEEIWDMYKISVNKH